VALKRTDVSEERIGSITMGRLRARNYVKSDYFHPDDGGNTFLLNTSVLIKATRLHTPDVGIPHSHRRDNLKSYIALTG
jgi:hypothetical protein